jgi:hypothetical protein
LAGRIEVRENEMLNDKIRSECEQGRALLSETSPPLWWSIYSSCKDCGFTEQQAMDLVKAMVSSMFGAANR